MEDFFTVRCSKCGRTIRIGSVSLYRSHQDLFSYGCNCQCGAGLKVDGAAGDVIPESLKRDAKQRRKASKIETQIDYERRALPPSATKTRLKESRQRVPVEQPDGTWLVYNLSRSMRVFYRPNAPGYVLSDNDGNSRTFTTVAELVDYLDQS